MKAPLMWLKDFVDIPVSTQELCDRMIMHGLGVEGVERVYEAYDKVVVGRLEAIVKHPDADKLQICTVRIAPEQTVTIVTGAPNVYEGMVCPVATEGADLPCGKHITAGELRGVRSCGMLCSGQELGLYEEELKNASVDGILDLGEAYAGKIGQRFFEAVGLDSDVIDFEISANRPDCMSILGIAREIGAALNVPVREPQIQVQEIDEPAADYASVRIEDLDLCPRYTARVMKDIHVGDSPIWMQRRLQAAGMNAISNIVDITNYVMLELGYPLHAFDYACVKDGHIIVRRGKAGEELITLDGKQHVLDESMLAIADETGAIGLAGVMGGENSEITDQTQMVLLEAAKFDGPNNRHTSRALGILSEAAARFSKGLDEQGVALASDRAAQLMVELGCGKVLRGRIDTQTQPAQPRTIAVTAARINAILGSALSQQQVVACLQREHIDVDVQGETLLCTVPYYRQDLAILEDLAEEVARVYGYDNIPLQPLSGIQKGGLTLQQKQIEEIRHALCGMGMHESMTMTLLGQGDFDAAGYAKDDPKRNCVRILNPLSEEYACVRTTVIPSMCKALALNARNRTLDAPLFELSNVHVNEMDQEGLPKQHMVLCMGMLGDSFYAIKGRLETLCAGFGAPAPVFVKGGGAQYHPMRKALLMDGDAVVGEMGELHPHVLDALGIDTRACVLELDVAYLLSHARTQITYQPLPRYPAMERDLAVLVDRQAEVGPMMQAMREAGGELLASVSLFDVYEGEQVEAGQKSVAFSLALRANDRTLKDEEANAVMERVLQRLQSQFGARLRGM